MRRLVLVVLVSCLPAAAYADRHRMGARFMTQSAFRSSIWGFGLGFEKPFDGTLCYKADENGKMEIGPDGQEIAVTSPGTLSFIGEFSMTKGTHDGEDLTQTIGMAGLRYTLNRAGIQPYGHFLLGGGRDKRGSESKTIGSASFGFGADIPLSSGHAHAAARELKPIEWVVFLQADSYVTFAQHQATDGYFQISGGVTLRFAQKSKKPCKHKQAP